MKKSDRRREEAGAITIPLLLLGALAMSFALALTLAFGKWRRTVEEQLAIDRCVGQTARKLVRIQDEVLKTNRALAALRTARAAALASGAVAGAALAPLMEAVRLRQEWLLAEWRMKQLTWPTRAVCPGNSARIAAPLMGHGWERSPIRDALGPGLLQRPGGEAKTFLILTNGGLYASALIQTQISANGLSGETSASWRHWANGSPNGSPNGSDDH